MLFGKTPLPARDFPKFPAVTRSLAAWERHTKQSCNVRNINACKTCGKLFKTLREDLKRAQADGFDETLVSLLW